MNTDSPGAFASLVRRVHGATDDDRVLEGLIFHALHRHEGDWSDEFGDGVWHRRDPLDAAAFDAPPGYLTSFAAALSVLRRGEMVSKLEQDKPGGAWTCYVVAPGRGGGVSTAPTAVRALLGAALDARHLLR